MFVKMCASVALFVVLSAFNLGAADAQRAEPIAPTNFYAWPPDGSCATWLSSDPSAKSATNQWVLGFWTGQNMMNPANHMVGSSTDGAGIIAEVEIVCRAEPSINVMVAAARVYHRLERERR